MEWLWGVIDMDENERRFWKGVGLAMILGPLAWFLIIGIICALLQIF